MLDASSRNATCHTNLMMLRWIFPKPCKNKETFQAWQRWGWTGVCPVQSKNIVTLLDADTANNTCHTNPMMLCRMLRWSLCVTQKWKLITFYARRRWGWAGVSPYYADYTIQLLNYTVQVHHYNAKYSQNVLLYSTNVQLYNPKALLFNPNAQLYSPNAQLHNPNAQLHNPNASTTQSKCANVQSIWATIQSIWATKKSKYIVLQC